MGKKNLVDFIFVLVLEIGQRSKPQNSSLFQLEQLVKVELKVVPVSFALLDGNPSAKQRKLSH